MVWPRTSLNINGKITEAIAPIIISASRATDIPAFYAKSFIDCLKKGYLQWKNPFNNKKILISFEKTKLIVFWSKNPAPIIPCLDEIKELGIDFYFNFTLNDYEDEAYEKQLPSLHRRIETFKDLSKKIGKENVIWRFDPIICTSRDDFTIIIDRINAIANEIGNYTNKFIFSFVDVSYKKVKQKFQKDGIQSMVFTNENKYSFASQLTTKLYQYKFQISTCAESVALSALRITPNKCIDNKLICDNFENNNSLIQFIRDLETKNKLKDKGQRKSCRCIVSKDIGRYNSCGHSCVYCYAMQKTTPGLQRNIFS